MRPWAGPIGFLGAATSLVFWLVVPQTVGTHNMYVHAGNDVFYFAFAALSVVGIIGAIMTPRSTRLAPALMALAIVPGIAALLIPGLMLVIAMLLALQEPEATTSR
jgi:hypothetical protein